MSQPLQWDMSNGKIESIEEPFLSRNVFGFLTAWFKKKKKINKQTSKKKMMKKKKKKAVVEKAQSISQSFPVQIFP